VSPDCFVVRPGGEWRGVVPVGLGLWVGSRPVLGDRVIFHDRPLAWPHGLIDGDGRCFFDGDEWMVVADGVEESWQERDGQAFVRYRAWIVDEANALVVGVYYWLEES
jgi:hypothetical protein